MEGDSFKRMLLTMVVVMGIIFAWQHFRGKDETKPQPAPQAPLPAAPKAAEDAGNGDGDAATKPPSAAAYTFGSDKPEATSDLVLGSSDYLGEFAMVARLTAKGAGIEHVELSDYFKSVDDRKKSPAEREKFQLVQGGVGSPGYVLSRLDLTRKGTNAAEVIRLDLPMSKPLAELNNGRGVRKGVFILADGTDAGSVSIDISDCTTIGDVIEAINRDDRTTVTASRHPVLDRLVLTGGESSEISVRESGEGHTAEDLGLLHGDNPSEGQPLIGISLGADPWWTVEGEPTREEVRFRLDIAHDGKPLLTVRKVLRLAKRPTPKNFGDRFDEPKAFAIEMELSFEDHSKTLSMVKFTLRGPEGLVKEETRSDGRVAVGGHATADSKTIFKGPGDVDDPQSRAFDAPLYWAGMVNKYFAFVAVADPEKLGDRFGWCEAYPAMTDDDKPGVGVALMSQDRPLDKQTHSLSTTYLLFAGPKDSDLLNKPLYERRGLVQLVQWSRGCCCCDSVPFFTEAIGGISKFMVTAIDRIADFVVNKGVAVIILVMLVRLLMLPISRYSQLSMLKMQDLQPEIAKLKERFKDDKQALQMEQMKLMRERGVNPMMGCLPMMLQMPIWIALYSGISVAIGLRHASFMLWIDDLARPDALIAFDPVSTPIVSMIGGWAQWQLNVLPILMVIMFYLQMKMQPQAASATPEAAQQQKMMKWMMPGMMFFFFYTAPSALNLYIMTSSFVGFWEQKYIRWHHAQIKLRPPKPRKEKPKGRFAQWMERKVEDARRLQDQARKSEPKWDKKKRDK